MLVGFARHGDVVVLMGRGEIDSHSGRVLVEHARRELAAGTRLLCIDLGGVVHLDSAGIAALVNVRRYVLRSHGALVLVAARESTLELLWAAGLHRHFAVVPSVDEALLLLAAATA